MTDYPNYTPYHYVHNNPIMLTDPTGMSAEPPTDFVDINSGKITTIDDGIDQTIALDGSSISTMQEIFNLDKGAYSDKLSELSNSDLNLGMNRSEFMFFAESLYAESSGGFGESLGIVNVLENRAANQGNTVMDQLSDKSPYGVYGVRKTSTGRNSDYKYSYQNEIGKPGTEQKRNNVHRAIAVGLTTSVDVTNGGMFWDGKDFNGRNKIRGGYNARYAPGYLFSDPSHDLWGQGSNKVNGTYKHMSTGAIGNTTFSKYYNQGKKWYTIN